MPHRKAFSIDGAVAVVPISTFILAVAIVLASPARAVLGPVVDPVLRSLRKSLGWAPSIDVVSDSQAVVVAVAGARIFVAGRILDADGGPVAGSAVRVQSEAWPGWDWVTSSGSDGSFHVDGVAAGKVRVAAQDVEAGTMETASLDADEARDVVLVLDRTVEVSGVVLDERSAPIARAAVKGAGVPGAPERVVVADEDGRFALRGAPRSIERLTVWARGFEASTLAVGAVDSGAVQRTVRLRAGRRVHGVVVDPAGNGVAAARVSACPGKEAEAAISDASGAFQLPATVIGCSVTADHPRFSSARALRIGDGRDLVLRLGAGGAIEGTAVDERGKPLSLFSVTIASFEAQEGAPDVGTRAGELGNHRRGSFSIEDLAPGTYVLQVSADGMVDAASRPIEVGRGRVVRGVQIVMTAVEIEDAPEAAEEPAPAEAEEREPAERSE